MEGFCATPRLPPVVAPQGAEVAPLVALVAQVAAVAEALPVAPVVEVRLVQALLSAMHRVAVEVAG